MRVDLNRRQHLSGDVGEEVLMILLGGMGTFAGPVSAPSTPSTCKTTWSTGSAPWATVIIGVIYVGCVLAFRKGFVGELIAWQHRRGKPAG